MDGSLLTSRRAFLGFCGAGALSMGFGAAVAGLSGDGELLRPPGGQDEARMHASCLRCDRCRSICPTGVIGIAPLEEGILNARTPTLDFHRGYCDFCALCETVCPTGALGSFDPSTEKIGTAVIQEDRCIAFVGGCTECFKACPYGAISLDASNRPVVDGSLCNGCGVCEYICPALAYRSFSGGTRRGVVVVTRQEASQSADSPGGAGDEGGSE